MELPVAIPHTQYIGHINNSLVYRADGFTTLKYPITWKEGHRFATKSESDTTPDRPDHTWNVTVSCPGK